MKVIFLDIDGVLNSTQYMNAVRMGYPDRHDLHRDKYGHLFDPRCVAFLAYIIKETGAKIVMSSTWRFSGLETMQNMWKDRNLPGELIDRTPNGYHLNLARKDENGEHIGRGMEIQEWLSHHPEVEKYVIIDDDHDMLPEQQEFFVQTSNDFGIDRKTALLTVEKLS